MSVEIFEHLLEPTLNKRKPYKTQHDAVIRELHRRGFSAHHIHQYLVRAYGKSVVNRGTVYERIRQFKAQEVKE